MKNWEMVKLGKVLIRQFDTVQIDDLKKYKRLTVSGKGQGVSLRDEVFGTEIGTKNQFKVRKGQFLLSKIDAMNGAFGIVPENCDEGVITGNFWTYEFNESVIDAEFLRLMCIGEVFTDFSLKASEGTTNRKYLREDKFNNLDFRLPPLPEQRRIVTGLKAVQEKIAGVKRLREEQGRLVANLLFSKYKDAIGGAGWKEMGEVAPLVRREVEIKESEEYPELGVRSFGKGTFHKPALSGIEVGTKKIYAIEPGDLIFSNVFAWEGAIAVAGEDDKGRYGSHRFITCVTDENEALAEFLCYHFLTEDGLEEIRAASPGGAGRNKTLGLKKLEKIKVPLPSIEKQREFIALKTKLESFAQKREQQMAALEGVLPGLLDRAFRGEV